MRLVLDTNRYVDLMASVPGIVEIVELATEVFVPFAVLGELRGGFANGNRRAVNERTLQSFLQKPFVKAVYADEQTVGIYAALYADLRRRGRTIPSNDLWIGAICVQHAAALYSRDRHFSELPQLLRI